MKPKLNKFSLISNDLARRVPGDDGTFTQRQPDSAGRASNRRKTLKGCLQRDDATREVVENQRKDVQFTFNGTPSPVRFFFMCSQIAGSRSPSIFV
jgi:hypothetical protein